MIDPNTPPTDRRGAEHPNTGQATDSRGVRFLRRARTIALTAVVALPPVLNADNIVGWANSPNGLGLPIGWAWIAFGGLDLIACVCVFETLIQSQGGRRAGAFAALVWLFAGASAYAGYRHGTQPGVGRDVKWFFPFMAVAGPLLLHLILKRNRLDKQLDAGRRLTHAPAGAYGWARWIPGVGALGETYSAWRLGRLEGIVQPATAIARYRALRPDAGRGGVRVLRALRLEADRQREIAASAVERPNTTTEHPATPPKPIAAPPTVRSVPITLVRPNGTPKASVSANTSPSGDVNANLKRIKRAFGDWRTNTPSARKIAGVLGVATSTGLAYRNRLIAEQANGTPADTPASDDEPTDPAAVAAAN